MAGAPVVRVATSQDLSAWLELVREVEPLFGPMPDFEQHADHNMARGTALVVTDDERLVAACLLSADDRPHAIHWLAVREHDRRRGIGSQLLAAIAARWPTGDIEVVTFAHDLTGSAPARRFYERHGFELVGPAPYAPDGSARDRYVLRRSPGGAAV